jgi:hypothetical protein
MPELTRRRKGIVCAVFLLALAFVGDLLHSYNTVPSGYVAVYPVMGMWVLTSLVAVAAAILLAIPRTRFVGFVFGAAIVFIPSSFVLGVKLSEITGLNHWRNAPMHRFGPDVPYSLVVYYQPGASNLQIEQFEHSQLYQPRSDARNLQFRTDIREFLRLAPSQAHGHSGFAINLAASVPAKDRSALIETISNDPLVFRIYRDIAPDRIADPDATESHAEKN